MNRIIKTLPIVTIALAGCHQGGVGVGAGADQKASTSTEQSLHSERSIHSSTTAQAAISMPAAALAQQAFQQYAKQNYLPPANAASSAQDEMVRRLIWEGSMQGPTKIDSEASARIFGAVAIASMSYPWQGWPFSCFGCKKEADWARGMAQQVIFANTILSQILPKISAQTLADPAAAQAAIIKAYESIPPAQLVAAYKQAGEQLQGGVNFDFSGSQPAPIHFMIGSNDFQASPTGWKWSMAGVPWYGEGRISGKNIELSLSSAIDKSQSQTSTTGTSAGAATEQGAGGDAGVK